MTLQNGMIHGGTAYLWTDTAHWNPTTGALIGHSPKAFSGASWPYAGVLSFEGIEASEVMLAVGNPANLKELLEAAGQALFEAHLKGGQGRFLLASHERKPRLHIVATFDHGFAKPFQPVEMDYLVCSASESEAAQRAVLHGFNLKRMRRIIDVQLQTPFTGHGSSGVFGDRVWIGGNIVRIEVGRGGVTSAVERAA